MIGNLFTRIKPEWQLDTVPAFNWLTVQVCSEAGKNNLNNICINALEQTQLHKNKVFFYKVSEAVKIRNLENKVKLLITLLNGCVVSRSHNNNPSHTTFNRETHYNCFVRIGFWVWTLVWIYKTLILNLLYFAYITHFLLLSYVAVGITSNLEF